MDTIGDIEKVCKIAKACTEKFLSITELRYNSHVMEVIGAMNNGSKAMVETCTPDTVIKRQIKRHEKYTRFYLFFYLSAVKIKNYSRENFPIVFSLLKKIKDTLRGKV